MLSGIPLDLEPVARIGVCLSRPRVVLAQSVVVAVLSHVCSSTYSTILITNTSPELGQSALNYYIYKLTILDG